MSPSNERVVTQLQPELKKYGIVVNIRASIFVYDNLAHKLEPYMDSRKLEKLLKEYIKRGKAKAEAAQQAKQGRLL